MVNPNNEQLFLEDINDNIGIVHRVCKICFITDKEEREDVFQEIMYQLWKSYPKFNGESKFSTWMYKVALNTAIVHVRKKKRAPGIEKLSNKYNRIPDSSREDSEKEKMSLLYDAINSLGNIDRAIILLYLEENSYDEIASITGLTRTNVSVRLVRIKRALKEKLKNTI